MRHYWILSTLMLLFFLLLFLLVEALGVPLLSAPEPWLKEAGPVTASVGVGLLLLDVLLPVPSSLLMVAHGALFGVIWGTLLSLLGSVGAAALAFAIGRRGGTLLERMVPEEERGRANALLSRWGGLAIILSRPVPMLAETLAILAGSSPLSWRQLLLAATLGNLPISLLYAFTGALAPQLESSMLAFALVMGVAGLFWLISRFISKHGT